MGEDGRMCTPENSPLRIIFPNIKNPKQILLWYWEEDLLQKDKVRTLSDGRTYVNIPFDLIEKYMDEVEKYRPSLTAGPRNRWKDYIGVDWISTPDTKKREQIAKESLSCPITSVYVNDIDTRFQLNSTSYWYEPVMQTLWL